MRLSSDWAGLPGRTSSCYGRALPRGVIESAGPACHTHCISDTQGHTHARACNNKRSARGTSHGEASPCTANATGGIKKNSLYCYTGVLQKAHAAISIYLYIYIRVVHANNGG